MFEGKIVGIDQSIYKGHSHGTLVIEKLKDYEKDSDTVGEDDGPEKVMIPFINENLVVEELYASGEKKVCSFPYSFWYTSLAHHVFCKS